MVHQSETSVPLMHHDQSITAVDPDLDHPTETHLNSWTFYYKEKVKNSQLPTGSQHKYFSDEFQKKHIFVIRSFRSYLRPESMLSDTETVKFYLERTGDGKNEIEAGVEEFCLLI